MTLARYSPIESLLPLAWRDSSLMWPDVFGFGRGFPVDIYESETGFTIEASLPGVKPADLKVTATSSTITIRTTTGEAGEPEKKAKAKKDGGYVRRERYTGVMTRVIELPEAINPTKITASYAHGVLVLEAPKAGESEAMSVPIEVGE